MATTMAPIDQQGFTSKDLRIKLFDLMKSKGIVDNVKSHLRGRLINELRGGVDDQFRFVASSTPPTLLIRALNALIVNYLQAQKYEYTTGVFIPEANINDYRAMTDEEILRLLNISVESTFFKKMKANSDKNGHESLLMSLLTSVASWLPGSSHSNGTQTSNDLWAGSIAGSTLDEKLNNLDAMYTNRRDDMTSMQHLSTEEKLLLFQKNIELRTRESLKQQMDQFREHEIKQIREEERLKCQMELQTLRKELETLYKSKQETLNEKEMRIGDRFKADLENEKRELYGQRQTFLEELKTMKMRESEFQRNLELRERSITLETDRLKRLEDEIRKREVTVSNTEIHVDQQVQMKLSKLRFEIEQQFTDRNKSLQLLEMRNQEESRRIGEERLLAEQAKSEVTTLRKHYSEADSTIHRLQSELKMLQNENDILREKAKQAVDYQFIREENAILKSQMGNVTSRSQRSHRQNRDSSSSSPRERTGNSRAVAQELKHVLDNQAVGQRVVNDELIDLKSQLALLQSSNDSPLIFDSHFPSNHGGDYLTRVLKSASDVQLNQTRHHSSSSNYNQFIEDAKLRMLELDREADRVEENFHDYQHRVLMKVSYPGTSQPTDIDYSSSRRMPSVKLSGQATTTNTMPASTSLQDISSHHPLHHHGHKFNWNKDQPLIRLPESLLSNKRGAHGRHLSASQSDDRIFEHPEVTIKPSALDDELQRRLTVTGKISSNNGSTNIVERTGSVPNILEHPDMRTPLVMSNQQISLSSSSSSTSENKHVVRQQSADVYTTLARSPSPRQSHPSKDIEFSLDQNWALQQRLSAGRTSSPRSMVGDIVESPELDKSDDAHSPPATSGRVQIFREFSERSSTPDTDQPEIKRPTGGTSTAGNGDDIKSEEDDFW